MLEEDKDQHELEEDDGEEIKLISISESIKIRKRISKERREQYERELAVLEERSDRLKKQIKEDQQKRGL